MASIDEGNDAVPSGIGKDRQSDGEIWHVANDRILHDWQQSALQFEVTTIAAKLAAIREFENFCGGTPFAKTTKSDIVAYREQPKTRLTDDGDDKLSVSAVRHRASHLKKFFEWLVEQRGYQGLDKTLPSFFNLPKKFHAAALSQSERPTPTVEEAVEMVRRMPSQTVKARRDRAIVAIAFLGALRADTIASLHVMHLDVEGRVVIQDARHSRTKNGKSLRVKFFPLPAVFSEVVSGWKTELVGLGFADADLLP